MSESNESKTPINESTVDVKDQAKPEETTDGFYNREIESIAKYILDTFVKSNEDVIDVEKHYSSLYDTIEFLRDNAEILLDMYCDEQKEAGKEVIYPALDSDNDDDDSDSDEEADEEVSQLPAVYEAPVRAFTDDTWSNEPPNRCKGCGESCYFAHEYCKPCYYSNAVKPVYYRPRR